MAVSNKVILDSNIMIYTGWVNSFNLREWFRDKNIYVSQISLIEVLGYHKLNY